MKKLLIYLEKYKMESIIAPLFKLLEVVFDLIVPLIVADIIDSGIAKGDTGILFSRFAILVALALCGLACSFTAQYFASKASVGFATDVRQALFDHVQKLSWTELDTIGTNTLITRMTSDVNQMQNGLNLALRLLLRSPFVVFGAMFMAFTIDVKCALIFLAAIPVLSIAVFAIMLVSIPLYKKVQTALDKVLGITRDNLQGVRVIRAFRKEEDEVRAFDQSAEYLRKISEKVGRISALLNPLTFALINIATILLIRQSAVQVSLGVINQGDTVALYNYMAQIIVELIKLANLIITIDKSLACAERVQAVFDQKTTMEWKETTEGKESETEAVRFDHVSFAYASASEEAVSDISFTVNKGETIGIIGATGCGKSTVANLIGRFYDATDGCVSVDGIDVKDYSHDDLNGRIGIVPQKAVLFAGSVRDNMKIADETASDEQIWNALRIAQAEDVVKGKDGQLDFMIESGGRNLSGGQRQRLTIARALVKNPQILILDDSASALDFATDARLRASLAEAADQRTVFIISQRISSIRSADRILVLEDGRLSGNGTHDELLESCEEYGEIYESQYPEKRKNRHLQEAHS